MFKLIKLVSFWLIAQCVKSFNKQETRNDISNNMLIVYNFFQYGFHGYDCMIYAVKRLRFYSKWSMES